MTRPRIGRMLEVPAGRVHVREDGPLEAPVIVLLHGFMCSLRWFDQVTPLLADTHRVLRLDLLGHGFTEAATQTGLDAPDQIAMVEQVLTALEVDEAVVVGHSFGADAAAGLAVASARVRQVVILAQAPDYSYATLPSAGLVMAVPVLGRVLHAVMPPSVRRAVIRPGFAPGFQPPAELLDQAVRDQRAMDPRMYGVVQVQRRKRLDAQPLDALVRDGGQPALAVLGRYDCFYDPEQTRARYQAVGAAVEVLQDAGHGLIVEQPGRVAELVRRFVASPSR